MLYHAHEMQRLMMAPTRAWAQGVQLLFSNPFNPMTYTHAGRTLSSMGDMVEHLTRRYGKPEWGLDETEIDGRKVAVEYEKITQRTWCTLLHFNRQTERNDPRVLVVAPLSGHYATLLRGTVETLLPDHDVYITDWQDARSIPVGEDRFNLNDYIDYVIDFLHILGPNTHVVAVCQPSVPVLAATAVMSGWNDTCVPATLTLMGGPVDTRKSPTAVNTLAKEQTIDWFERNVVVKVPPPYAGAGRKVYPGFIQLTNFIAMNFDKHMESYNELFEHLVRGDDDAAEKKFAFYEEYRSVMDLPAEYYLQTVETVFQNHSLPKGEMTTRWHPVLPEKIDRTAILCVEGELDDISGIGQTKAALEITTGLKASKKKYHLQKNVGHYGIFNGGKWRDKIAPVVKRFIRKHDLEGLGGAKTRKPTRKYTSAE